MSSGENVIYGICLVIWWQHRQESPTSIDGSTIYARKAFESARASLKASLIFLDSRKSSYKVIQAEMLANWANTSDQNGNPVAFLESFWKRSSFYFIGGDPGASEDLLGLNFE